MENASKALLMAGGVLIGILVIGALVLMVNQLGSYQRQNLSSEAEKQVAQFNQDFIKFTDQNIKGVDIITLVNKVIDHNKRSGAVNSLNYDIKITLTINVKEFAGKYGTGGVSKMFENIETITINQANGETNDFSKIINMYTKLENQYGLDRLRKLSANFNSVYGDNPTKNVEDIIGVDDNNFKGANGKLLVEKYREYSEFKTSVFSSNGSPTYTNGQVSGLAFKFIK